MAPLSSRRAEGSAHPQFERVARTFEHQLARTPGGAAVAVYYRGKLVVDLWGGRRTVEGDPWKRDTLALGASTTKGVAATAAHILADRSLLEYDAPVADYWPEFAQNGKEAITVRQVLSHSAGLHRLRTLIDHGYRVLDWDHMVDALSRAAPSYEPGTSVGYHGLTYGWLVGELVRRISGQPIAEFVQREIAEPLGVDGLFIGCPPEARHRIAPSALVKKVRTPPPLKPLVRLGRRQLGWFLSAVHSPLNLRRYDNMSGGRGVRYAMASPAMLDASIPSANGFFDAVSLARMYAMLAGGGAIEGVRLLSPPTVARLSEIQHDERDRMVLMRMRWRLGYHGIIGAQKVLPKAFGHFGYGGSGAWADPGHDLALAMVCSRGTGTPMGDQRIVQLTRAVAASVGSSFPTMPLAMA